MRRRLTPPVAAGGVLLGVAVVLAGATPALGATSSGVALPIAGLGGLLGGIAHTVLGGVDWTVEVAGDFIMNLLGGLIRDLIPRSWITKGLQIMGWLVAVPNYSGRVPSPGGGEHYGFAGVNAMRELYTWLGMAILPLTLVYATSRSWSGQGDPPSVPLSRVLVVAVGLVNYTWLWSQAVALSNQITHAILAVPAVTSGIDKMFEVLIAGAALGGLPLIGLLVMGVGGVQLIALIFVKVALIVIGAVVFAIGPAMIGLVATERGHAFARAWLTMALGIFVLPILWASIFAIAAVLINDASSGSAVLGTGPGLGRVIGGLLIALAAIAGFWLAIKLTKAFGSLVSGQLAGLLAIAGGGARALLGGAGRATGSGGSSAAGAAGAVASLRGFGAKVGGAAAGAAGALLPAGRAGAVLAGAGGAAAALGRGGLLGAGVSLASRGAASAATSSAGRAAASTRAGAVATRAARGARRGWNAAAGTPPTAAASSSSRSPRAQSVTTANAGREPSAAEIRQRDAADRDYRIRHGVGDLSDYASAERERAARSSAARVSSPRPSTSSDQPRRSSTSAQPSSRSSASSDPANDAARNAFGEPSAPKPTRRARDRFKRGPRT